MSKIDELLERASRFLAKKFGLESERHPGKVHHGRNVISSRKKPTENPHLTSWTRYMKHLFNLILDGYGRSPAAMQVRDRLQFHWKFMDRNEHAEAMNRYQYAKIEHEQRRVEQELRASEDALNQQHFRDIAQEIEHFMAPKVN